MENGSAASALLTEEMRYFAIWQLDDWGQSRAMRVETLWVAMAWGAKAACGLEKQNQFICLTLWNI
jgi:hypothetical protein